MVKAVQFKATGDEASFSDVDNSEISSKILSDITTWMKYARYIPEKKRRETWDEVIDRNMTMHITKYPQLENEIRDVYENYIRTKKVLPSMRSLQFAGKPIEISPSRIYNCSFLPIDDIRAFSEVMFLLLGGTGVGYSVQKHHVAKLPPLRGVVREQDGRKRKKRFLISDSIEGWADAIKVLMESYFTGEKEIEFDYRDIRPKGARLVTSGGKAPGPQPLKDCVHDIRKVLDSAIVDRGRDTQLKPIEAHDILCYIADAVLSGGIRRAAMISLFSFDDNEMLSAKAGKWYELNPQRARANNSVVILRHRIQEDKFLSLWEKIKLSNAGEPGIFFTNDKEIGTNPCGEISLKAFQFCNLSIINASNIVDQEDFNARARAAAFVGTLQAGYTEFHYLREVWRETTEKEALVGVSATGIASGPFLNLDEKEAALIVKQENERVAKLIGINKAARTTCVKPEGCQIPSTMVATNSGIFEMGELGDINKEKWQEIPEVKTVVGDKESNLIGKFFNNGESTTKKITMSSGLKLESTLNHKYRILKDGQYIWVKSEHIKKGDVIPYQIGTYSGGSYQKLTYNPLPSSSRGNTFSILTPEILDEDLAWLIGLYFADGSNHEKGIRISGNWNEQKGFSKVMDICVKKFGLNPVVVKHSPNNPKDLRCQVEIHSTLLKQFLQQTGLEKEKSYNISVPLILRKSPTSVIKAFFDGFIVGDENESRKGCPSFVTTSEKFAMQSTVILRMIGEDAKVRRVTSITGGFGDRQQYWVSVRKGRTSENYTKQREYIRKAWKELDNLGFSNMSVDIVEKVEDSTNYTVDIEVPNTHTYLANSYVSHNTSSLVLGTSSGIHAWHNDYYIRRVRVGKTEAIYNYLRIMHPSLLEDDYFKPDQMAVISIPQKAPEGAILRTENALDLLERMKHVAVNWITTGHRKGSNKNNVSLTASIKENEWGTVGAWMWENRDIYSGITVLPYDNGSYIQAPFEDCTKEKYEEMLKTLVDVDVSHIIEEDDETNLTGELACAGGACEIQ